MTLRPNLPPGRANRKALQFSEDIVRLREAGYTYSAIRLALLDAGVNVGLSTIKREAARIPCCAHMKPQDPPPATEVPAPSAATRVASPTVRREPGSGDARSGRQIAAEFFEAHPDNPLFRNKEMP